MSLFTRLSSYWEMEETSGARSDQQAGRSLSDNNTVTSGAGKVGTYSAQFTSANSEWLESGSNTFFTSESWTFAGWFLFDSTGLATIAATGPDGVDLLFFTRSNRIELRTWRGPNHASGAYTTTQLNYTQATATWYFMCATYDSATLTQAISINDGTPATSTPGTGIPGVQSSILIGKDQSGVGYLNGRIDALGYWRRVLTSGEITQLYNGGNGMTYAAILATAAPGGTARRPR